MEAHQTIILVILAGPAAADFLVMAAERRMVLRERQDKVIVEGVAGAMMKRTAPAAAVVAQAGVERIAAAAGVTVVTGHRLASLAHP
jgi:hypothetical protein